MHFRQRFAGMEAKMFGLFLLGGQGRRVRLRPGKSRLGSRQANSSGCQE